MAFTSMMAHGELDEVRHSWRWLLAVGILLLLLGIAALSLSVATTVVTVITFGVVLCFSGAAEIFGALRPHTEHGASRLWLGLLAGVLDLVLGVLLIVRPLAGAAVLTLVLAAFFFVGGIYRMFGAVSLRMPSWGWSLLSGVIDVTLAILLLSGWPVTALWFIGFCIGVGLIFRGWACVMLALLVHRLPEPQH